VETRTAMVKYITVVISSVKRYFGFMRHHRRGMYALAAHARVTGVT